jgi:hypothetical protein
MKVKFCSHSPILGHARTLKTGIATINPAWLFVETYYDLHGQNPNIVWLKPQPLILDTIETIIKDIISDAPDVLGLGVYFWNNDIQFCIAKAVKKALPEIIIVLGGPDLSVHKMTTLDQVDFFVQHPYVDYVVYGDGEKPFTQIIDYHSGFIQNKNDFVNIVENNSGNPKLYQYEMLTDDRYLATSPYLYKEEKIRKYRDYLESRGVERKNQLWTIEFARGCMYSCTFCDWSQNLTKKVKRRTHNWKADIDLFWRLDLPIRESDANFGQWQQDIDAFDYACSLYDSQRNFSFIPINTPKLKKNVTEHILLKTGLLYDSAYPTISMQDIHRDVLNAIDRPSVSWEQHVEMISKLREKLPNKKFQRIMVETLLGLPEQTLEKIIDTYVQLFELGITKATWHWWIMLENSPAADPAYQKKWGLEVKEVYATFDSDPVIIGDLEQLCQDIVNGDAKLDVLTKKPLIIGHKKMSTIELWAAKILQRKWQDLNDRYPTQHKYDCKQVRKILEKICEISLKEAAEQYAFQKSTMDKYGIILWGHIDTHKQILHAEF